jgi:hypothetical protein
MTMPQSQRKIDGGRIPGSAEITNCIEIRMIFTLANGKQASVRTHGISEGTFVSSSAMANQLFTAISGHWVQRLAPHLNPTIVFTALGVRDMSLKTNPEFLSSLPAVPSTGTGDAMPQDVALVLTAEGLERGRGAKGRLYMPGWSENANAGGGIASASCVSALTAFGTDLRQDLNAVALTAAIAKPARNEYIGLTGAHHDARAAHATQVTAYICQNGEWDTQRRRGL